MKEFYFKNDSFEVKTVVNSCMICHEPTNDTNPFYICDKCDTKLRKNDMNFNTIKQELNKKIKKMSKDDFNNFISELKRIYYKCHNLESEEKDE